MFCARCGAELDEEYVFCTRCGSPAPVASSSPEPPPRHEPDSPDEGEPPSAPEPSFSPGLSNTSSEALGAPDDGAPEQRTAPTPRIKLAILCSLLVILMLAASFGISVAVVEWRGSDGGASIGVDVASEWVACQAKVANSILADDPEAAEGFLTESYVERIKDSCDISSDLWVFCANDKFLELTDAELESFGAERASTIADRCREDLR